MASSALSSPLLPSLNSTTTHPYPSPPSLFSHILYYASLIAPRSPPYPPPASFSRSLSLIPIPEIIILGRAFAGSQQEYASEEAKNKVLESYGLDPSYFIDEPSPRSRRRRKREETDKAGKGRQKLVLTEAPKRPCTTRRLLEVLGGKSHRSILLSSRGMDFRPMIEVVRGAAFDILQLKIGHLIILL